MVSDKTEAARTGETMALTEAARRVVWMFDNDRTCVSGNPSTDDLTDEFIDDLNALRAALLAAPAPSEPGLDEETLARALDNLEWLVYERNPAGPDKGLPTSVAARDIAAEYARLRGGQE